MTYLDEVGGLIERIENLISGEDSEFWQRHYILEILEPLKKKISAREAAWNEYYEAVQRVMPDSEDIEVAND